MRIGAKNSTPASDRKHFLVRSDAKKALFPVFARRRNAWRRLQELLDARKPLENKARRALMNLR
jgi:hypothetical protein